MSSIQSFYFVGVITLVSSAHVYGQKKDKMNVLFIINGKTLRSATIPTYYIQPNPYRNHQDILSTDILTNYGHDRLYYGKLFHWK